VARTWVALPALRGTIRPNISPTNFCTYWTQLLAIEALVMAGAAAVVETVSLDNQRGGAWPVIHYAAKGTRRQGDARTRLPRRTLYPVSSSSQKINRNENECPTRKIWTVRELQGTWHMAAKISTQRRVDLDCMALGTCAQFRLPTPEIDVVLNSDCNSILF
jgi:hypothetical protein